MSSELGILNSQLSVVSDLQEGERLFLSISGSLSKMASPGNIKKFFHAIYRQATFQSELRSLKTAASHINSYSKSLNDKLEPSHALLDELVKAENSLTLLLNQGFRNYKKTLESGAPWLFPKDHTKCLNEVHAQMKSINDLLPILSDRIQSCQAALTINDEPNLKNFLGGLKLVKTPLVGCIVFDELASMFGMEMTGSVFRAYSLDDKTILKANEAYALLAGLYAARLRRHYEGEPMTENLWRKVKKFNPLVVNNKKEPYSAQLTEDLEELQKFKDLNLVSRLHFLNGEWDLISRLKAGERLNVSRSGLLGRVSSPEQWGEKAPKLIKKVVILASRIFLAIYRLLTGQSDEKSLAVCAERIVSLKRVLRDLESVPRTNHFVLDELVKAEAYFDLIQNGYDTYNFTINCSQEINQQKQEIEALRAPLKAEIELFKAALKPIDKREMALFIENPNGVMPLWLDHRTSLIAQVVSDELTAKFSQKAVERAFSHYNLKDKTILNCEEIYSLWISLSVNVIAEDYEEFNVDRLIDLRNINPIPVSTNVSYKAQLERDLKVLAELKNWELFRKGKNSRFADLRTGEYLARYAIYGLFANLKEESEFAEGLLVPGVDEAGEPICFRTKRLVAKDGVMGACFVPHNRSIDHIYVAFRGLNCLESVFRCFDLRDREGKLFYNAVGSKSYKKHEAQILNEINEFLNKGIKINVLGHSLGGVDAQRLALALAKSGHKVDLMTFNSPGVDKADAEELVPVADLVTIHHFQVERDILQDPGHVRLGSGLERGLKVSIFEHVYKGEDPRYVYKIWWDAHRLPLLSDPVSGDFETVFCETLENRDAETALLTGLGAYAN